MSKLISRTVLLLSLVSLFTDIASEMLYPVIPIYLASLQYTAMYIGILEGIAEFIAGISKGYFGIWSDKIQQRLPFVRTGYILSALSKPLMIVFSNAWWILLTRVMDRLGKGIRTASRDALLSCEATPETKGRVFGFHRAMDTLGAAIGPLIALLFLYVFPQQYHWLFIFTVIPGAISIALLFAIKEKKKERQHTDKISFFSFYIYAIKSSKAYKILITGFLMFSLFNSSDMFLLLKLKEQQYDDIFVITMYIIYNLSYALMSYPAGILADRLGINKVHGRYGLVCRCLLCYGMGCFRYIFVADFFRLWILCSSHRRYWQGMD